MTVFEQASNDIEKDKYNGSDIENVVEWLKNSDRATLSFTQGRMVTKIRKLKEQHPEDVEIVLDTGASIVAHIPVKWVKVSAGRHMTEEQKKLAGERLRKTRSSEEDIEDDEDDEEVDEEE